ncbi:MAG: 1-deoxy-D-xylulose-5-phosphate reductoisomerase [Eggerthellaceae bacterium]|nr:1-deoxy-D-xylulose-5-phosphate reductoisomerase [Eggerthellaceae bacterium]
MEESQKKKIVVLGSTGSIGLQTLDVVRQHSDKLQVVGLSVYGDVDTLLAQAHEFGVKNVAVGRYMMKNDARVTGFDGRAECGSKAIAELAALPEADIIVNAVSGAAGMRSSYNALKAGKVLALANKESLVVAGELLMPMARASAASCGVSGAIVPIDSEHGAIYQCLIGEDMSKVSNLWLTASGGPFRGWKADDLIRVTPEQALGHPTWNMGKKITIDSATLMNKGLELIEASWLYDMPFTKIQVVIQPQSAVHSMVEYCDGSVKAHMGPTDMRIPIQYALSYPDRWSAPVEPMDFCKLGSIEFEEPDWDTFECLRAALYAGRRGGTLPCVMNAANEVAVTAFLNKSCGFMQIGECVSSIMETHMQMGVQEVESIEQLEGLDNWARFNANTWLLSHQVKK